MSVRPLCARCSGKNPRLPTIMPNVTGRDLPLFILLCLSLPYQKIIFNAMNAAATMPAQKMGRCQTGRWPSDGITVQPYTRLVSSDSGFGLVIRLTTTVTITHTIQDQRARNMFSAISFALEDMATYCSAVGSSLTQAHMPMEDAVPAARPQKPPAGEARFHNMPSSTVPKSGAIKKLDRKSTRLNSSHANISYA